MQVQSSPPHLPRPHTRVHARTHTHTRAHTHARTHTHTHTHTHTNVETFKIRVPKNKEWWFEKNKINSDRQM